MAVKREKVVRTAEKYVQRGKINAAIREYRKVLAEQPDDATTLNRVGDLYARSDQIEEAIGLFTQIAENYTADGFFPKATAIYKKIIKLDPTRLGVYEKLAELYHRQGLLNEARTQYQVLADYYVKHDNSTSATAIYERMTEVNPEDPSLRVRLAELYQEQKLLDKAMAQYQDIAGLMLDHGHPDDAEQVLLKGLEVDAADLEFIESGVTKLHQAGADGAAARFLARAVEANPEAASIADRVTVGEVDEEADADEAAVAEAPGAEPEGEPERAAPEAVAAAPALEDDEADLVLDVDDSDLDAEEYAELTGAGTGAGEEPSADTVTPETGFDTELTGGEITLDLDGLDDLDDLGTIDDQGGLDLDDVELAAPPSEDAPAAQAAATSAAAGTAPEPELPRGVLSDAPPSDGSIDPDFLERTAAELHPERSRQEEDLLTEAEVLIKYGLTEKATERLGELLALNPDHVGGRALLIRLHVEQGSHEGAAELATDLAVGTGGTEAWSDVWQHLADNGFEIDDRGVVSPPASAEARDELADEEVEEATPGAAATAATPETRAADEALFEPTKELNFDDLDTELDAPFFDVEGDVEGEAESEVGAGRDVAAEEPAAQEPPETPPVDEAAAAAAAPPAGVDHQPQRKRRKATVEDMLASLTDEVLPGRRSKTSAPPATGPRSKPAEPAVKEPLPEAPAPAEAIPEPPAARKESPAEPPAEPPAAAEAVPEPEASPDWLEHTVSGEARGEEGLFSEEDDFFDLAAELEEELSQEGALAEDDELLLETPKEQSLEEIVEGFKKGVSENLSQEDHNTHFDLGIAYREMGLLDEAIGEFQVAAKSPDLLVECCSMLGLSFLEKGLPELAVKWYRRGLEVPALPEERQLGLLYDLGNAYMLMGDTAQAHATFVDIYGTNSNYRDVVAKIEETRPR